MISRLAPLVLLLSWLAVVSAEVTPGEILIAEMNCAACHTASPELAARLASRQSPILGPGGAALNPEWIRTFLTDPQKEKPGTLMPDCLHGLAPEAKTEAADALTHYLVSLQPAPAPAPEADTALGDRLYHSVGCVMCHAPLHLPAGTKESPEKLAETALSSVPLGDALAAKYPLASLAAFLLEPLKTRPSGRMPSLQLTPAEAAAVAAYIAQGAKATAPFTLDPAKATRGRDLFAELNCGACHAGVTPGRPAKPLTALVARQPRGCLSARPAPSVPVFDLTARQKQVILSLLQQQDPLELPLEPEQQIRRTLTTLNCYACHVRERRGGIAPFRREYCATSDGRTDAPDELRIPPTLTKVGTRLDRAALLRSLTEPTPNRRMSTRMPLYGPANISHLPELIEQSDHR